MDNNQVQNMPPILPSSYVDDYAPPAPSTTMAPDPAPPMMEPAQTPSTPPPSAMHSSQTSQASQTIEDQNIFHMLGIENAKEEEKETFLDELQQVIWEDFLASDVELLLTEDELTEFKKFSDKQGISDEQRQSEMIEYLEKYVPDLEKIMLEKALELKEEMMKERIKDALEVYKDKPEYFSKVQQAKEKIDSQQWRDAADALNSLPPM